MKVADTDNHVADIIMSLNSDSVHRKNVPEKE